MMAWAFPVIPVQQIGVVAREGSLRELWHLKVACPGSMNPQMTEMCLQKVCADVYRLKRFPARLTTSVGGWEQVAIETLSLVHKVASAGFELVSSGMWTHRSDLSPS